MEEQLMIQIVNTVVSILGFVAVVVSLLSVRRSFKTSSNNTLYQEIHQIHSTFIQYPKFRPIFYNNSGLEILESEDDKLRAFAIAELFFDTFELIYQLSDNLNRAQKKMYKSYLHSMLESSSFLVSYLEKNIDLVYPDEFKKDVLEFTEKHKTSPSDHEG